MKHHYKNDLHKIINTINCIRAAGGDFFFKSFKTLEPFTCDENHMSAVGDGFVNQVSQAGI
jgi:hypothetical protein